jgi:hypothetical protein
MTPMTGIGNFLCSRCKASAEEVLQAMARSLMPFVRRKSALSREYFVTA